MTQMLLVQCTWFTFASAVQSVLQLPQWLTSVCLSTHAFLPLPHSSFPFLQRPASTAAAPPRATAPAATPARVRSACRRDRVWPKRRTSPSKRSESMPVPSVHDTPEGTRPRPAEHSTQAGSARSAIAAQAISNVCAPDGLLSEAGSAYSAWGECQ